MPGGVATMSCVTTMAAPATTTPAYAQGMVSSVVQPLPISGVITAEKVTQMATPVALPTISMPLPDGALTAPPRLTSGLPDPSSIAKQREAYLKALEEQERQAIAVLEQQRSQQVSLLRAQGDQQKKKFFLEVNQQVSQNDIVLTQQHSEQMMVLNQQYSQQRGCLENQANSLIMEFQQKKAQEDMMMQQYSLQLEQHTGQQKYNEEMVRLQQGTDRVQGALAQAYASSYMPPPIARQSTYLPTVTQVGTGPVSTQPTGSYQPIIVG